MTITEFPRRRYTSGRTTIDLLPRITEELGGPNLYIKRDDQLGLAVGGNKTRKLEFLMADALAGGADTIITTGGIQSNHCRLTLCAAKVEGLACRLLLREHQADSYDPRASGNNLLYQLLGADDITVTDGTADAMDVMMTMADDVTREGGTPYIIQGGGSSPLGALGYVSCAEEIVEQSRELAITFEHVVCASGSGGTQAGLLAGLSRAEGNPTVTGISVSASTDVQEAKVHSLAVETAALAGIARQIALDSAVVLDEYVGPGYALPTRGMAEAVRLFAQTEGILLDPVYSGKAAAGLIDMVRRGKFAKDDNVLFVHTGGSPALYAHPEDVIQPGRPT